MLGWVSIAFPEGFGCAKVEVLPAARLTSALGALGFEGLKDEVRGVAQCVRATHHHGTIHGFFGIRIGPRYFFLRGAGDGNWKPRDGHLLTELTWE